MRRAQPTKLKILKGEKDKRRINTSEPDAPVGRPDPPSWFSDDQLTVWNRLCDAIESMGILSTVDAETLAMATGVYCRWQDAARDITTMGITIETKYGIQQNPAVNVANQAETQFRQFAGCFGLTPSGRSSLHVDESKKKNTSKLSQFLG